MKRLPAGSLDALATVMHAAVCINPAGHTWRDHSGTSYHRLAAQAAIELDKRGLEVHRRKKQVQP